MFGGGKRPYVQVASAVSKEDLEKLAELTEEGKLNIWVEDPVSMENALEAFERRKYYIERECSQRLTNAIVHSRRARGKLIIKVHED